MILTQTQANGIYDSMCLANNFGGRVNMTIGSHTKTTIELETLDDGCIVVSGDSDDFAVPAPRETYANQAEFAAAYGLQ
jgi:hypothetical protein